MRVCLLSCLLFGGVAVAGETPRVRSEFIFERAPFPQAHASTLADTGTQFVAAWFGGTRERHQDVGIWVSRHEGGQWTPPAEVANGVQHRARRHPCWNPVLFQQPGGPLLLFYKVGPSPDTWWGMLTTSADGGKTWSEPRRLPEEILGPVKNKPILLPDGALLCGSSSEHDGWRVHFELTRDWGRTWERIGPVEGRRIGAIQPSMLTHADGRLQALGRTREGKIFQTWSTNGGLAWSELTLTSLPNPNAGTDAVTLRDGRHVLVYNHTSRGRSPLNVAVSRDGRQWQAVLELENEPGAEFSYPAVIQAHDGTVHVTYTWKRQRVKHAVLDPAQLSGPEMLNGQWPK